MSEETGSWLDPEVAAARAAFHAAIDAAVVAGRALAESEAAIAMERYGAAINGLEVYPIVASIIRVAVRRDVLAEGAERLRRGMTETDTAVFDTVAQAPTDG